MNGYYYTSSYHPLQFLPFMDGAIQSMDGKIHQWNATLIRNAMGKSVTVIERQKAHSFIQCEVT